MRLDILDHGHSRLQKLQLALIRKMMGGTLPGPIPALSYRAGFFGKEFNDLVQLALRGTKYWHKAEAELFAAFVSMNNRCTFCYEAHQAIAIKGIDEAVVTAVMDDWQTAPVRKELRATLGFIAKLTTAPDKTTPADLAPLFAAGVPEHAIEEAVRITFIFSTINRLADAFDFELANETGLKRMGLVLFNTGYVVGIVPG